VGGEEPLVYVKSNSPGGVQGDLSGPNGFTNHTLPKDDVKLSSKTKFLQFSDKAKADFNVEISLMERESTILCTQT
jgi:hypothetical protein